jgi:hypothetical protein
MSGASSWFEGGAHHSVRCMVDTMVRRAGRPGAVQQGKRERHELSDDTPPVYEP